MKRSGIERTRRDVIGRARPRLSIVQLLCTKRKVQIMVADARYWVAQASLRDSTIFALHEGNAS